MNRFFFRFVVGLLFLLFAAHLTAAQSSSSSCARNTTYPTDCAEEDNVRVPIFVSRLAAGVDARITATHPRYTVTNWSCLPDFTNCEDEIPGGGPGSKVCSKLYDDGFNVVHICTESGWWRSHMSVAVRGGLSGSGNLLVFNRRLAVRGEAVFYPEFAVIYSDGNMRLKPLVNVDPDVDNNGVQDQDNCYGSSVLIGPPSDLAGRPYADITHINVFPPARPSPTQPICVWARFAAGGSANVCLNVSRSYAAADLYASYPVDFLSPIVVFRSNYVNPTKNDVSHMRAGNHTYPIVNRWQVYGRDWFFFRQARSDTRQSSPDIRVQVFS